MSSKKKRLVSDLRIGDQVFLPEGLVSLHDIVKIEDIETLFASAPKGKIITFKAKGSLHKGKEARAFLLDDDRVDTKARPSPPKRVWKWLSSLAKTKKRKFEPVVIRSQGGFPPLLAK